MEKVIKSLQRNNHLPCCQGNNDRFGFNIFEQKWPDNTGINHAIQRVSIYHRDEPHQRGKEVA